MQTAKVYFRSRLYSDFYYVEMKYEEGRYVGILPQPLSDTPGIIYYLEALDSAFNTARSREFTAVVEERCRTEPAAAYLAGASPAITVGATTAGVALLPPGFSAAGVVATITAAGVAGGVGGGIGAGTAVAVGAAAAGAASAAVLTTGGGEETTPSGGVGAQTSSPTTTPPSEGGGTSTSTIPAGGSTTAPSTSTTTTSVPSGSTTTTAIPESTTTIPESTTTIPASTTTTAPTLDASCYTVEILGQCKVRVDATCVSLPVDDYEWILDLNGRWKKFTFGNAAPTLTHTWSPSDCGADETLRFRLKVRRGAETSTVHKNVLVPGDDLKASQTGKATVHLQTHLALEDGHAQGRLFLNGALLRVVEDSQPVDIQARGAFGTNTIVGVLSPTSPSSGFWRFDLIREPKLVPGSLRILSGRILAIEPSAVVFAIGERIELSFELRN